MTAKERTSWNNLAASIFIVILMLALVISSYKIRGTGGVFPQYISLFGLLVAIVDLALKTWGLFYSGNAAVGSSRVDFSQFYALIWPAIFVALTYIAGFYVALPAFMMLFFSYKRTLKPATAALILVGFSISMYLVFVKLLGVSFYPGLLNITLS